MTTEDFIIELFCRVDDMIHSAPKHCQAKLYPSEVVTLALLSALKGVGNRAFYRWLARDFQASVSEPAGAPTAVSVIQLASRIDGAVHG